MQNNFDPELVSELHSSNRIIQMDARIREIINYLEKFSG